MKKRDVLAVLICISIVFSLFTAAMLGWTFGRSERDSEESKPVWRHPFTGLNRIAVRVDDSQHPARNAGFDPARILIETKAKLRIAGIETCESNEARAGMATLWIFGRSIANERGGIHYHIEAHLYQDAVLRRARGTFFRSSTWELIATGYTIGDASPIRQDVMLLVDGFIEEFKTKSRVTADPP